MKAIDRMRAISVRYLFSKFIGFYPYPEYIEYKISIENLCIDSLEEDFKNKQIKLMQKNISS